MDWIDVREEIPFEPDIYLIAVNINDGTETLSKSIITAYFNGNYFVEEPTGVGIESVTHWCELPDIPDDFF